MGDSPENSSIRFSVKFDSIQLLASLEHKVIMVVPYSITTVWLKADPGFLAVSPQMTLVINPVVGCHYFPPGPRLLSQPKRSPAPWPVPNYTAWWQRHTGVSSLPKATSNDAQPWLKPGTCKSQVRRPINSATASPHQCINITKKRMCCGTFSRTWQSRQVHIRPSSYYVTVKRWTVRPVRRCQSAPAGTPDRIHAASW